MPDSDNYECACTEGWYGKNCAHTDPCDEEPCQNDGTCTMDESSGEVTYTCSCMTNFG